MPQTQQSLAGLNVLVTGASQGIGFALAEAAGQAGATVWLAARREAELNNRATEMTAQGIAAQALPMDVTDEASVQQGFQRMADANPRLDMVILAAGLGQFMPLSDTSAETFEQHWRVNVLGSFLCIREALRIMSAQGHGHIVTVGSIAETKPFPFNGAYASSKMGLRGLVGVLREEAREHGIRVTHVIPGATDTPLWDPTPAEQFPREKMMRARDLATQIVSLLNPANNAIAEEIILKPAIGEF